MRNSRMMRNGQYLLIRILSLVCMIVAITTGVVLTRPELAYAATRIVPVNLLPRNAPELSGTTLYLTNFSQVDWTKSTLTNVERIDQYGSTTATTRNMLRLTAGKTTGTFKVFYDNCGYTQTGQIVDVVVSGIAEIHCSDSTTTTYTTGIAADQPMRAFYKVDSHEYMLRNWTVDTDGTVTSRGANLFNKVDTTIRVFKDGTYNSSTDSGTVVNDTFIFYMCDLDVPDETRMGGYAGQYTEGLEFVNHTGDLYIGEARTQASGHQCDGATGVEPSEGQRLQVGTFPNTNHLWARGSHNCHLYGQLLGGDSEVAIKTSSGLRFIWRAAGNGPGSQIGLQSHPKYPALDNPSKTPTTQDKQLGDDVTWTISQTFPYVDANNKAASVEFSDTLEAPFNASQTTVTVKKGSTDVTSNWTKTISGQTIKMTTTNTGHGVLEGAYTFTISTKLKQDADLGSYPLSNKKRTVPNVAQIAVTQKDATTITKTTNTANVVVEASPNLVVEKAVSPSSVANPKAGESSVTWTIKVTNSGKETVKDITLTDALLTDRSIGVTLSKTTLAPGESTTITPTMTVKQADINKGSITNTARAQGTDTITNEQVTSNTAEATVTLERNASLTIDKVASPLTTQIGKYVSYDITVTNTGNVTLAPVTVTDHKFNLVNEQVANKLDPNEFVTISRTYGPVTEADAIAGSVVNTASAHGTPPSGMTPPADPSDTATVTVTSHPALSIKKTVNDFNSLSLTGNDAVAGNQVTWQFYVTNTGDVTINDLSVTDSMLSGRGISVSLDRTTLPPNSNQVATGTVTMNLTQSDIDAGTVTNVAHATGISSTGVAVNSPEDDATVTIERRASLAVEKSVSNGATSVAVGEDVIFDVTVTNTGNVTLRNVTITDPLTGNENLEVAESLAPQASVTTQVTYGPVTEQDAIVGSVTNTVSAHGDPPDGVPQPETPSDSVTIPVTSSRSLKITKSVMPTHLTNPKKNDTVTWSMTIENTGTLTLNGIALTDELLHDRNVEAVLTTTTLTPGQSVTIDDLVMPLKQEDIDAGSITNTATATATDPLNPPEVIESNTAQATVTLDRTPNVSVTKTAREGSVNVGSRITYDITVRNTGNVTLTTVKITDEKLSIINQEVAATLAPGNEVTVSVTSDTVTEGDAIAGIVQNVVTATGRPPTGLDAPTDTDTETVMVTGTTSLAIEKTTPVATIQGAAAGTPVTWNFTVRNEGTLTVHDISVIDGVVTGHGASVMLEKTTLAPQESTLGTATMNLTQSDIDAGTVTNVAHATGISSTGVAVNSPEDDATVTIERRASLAVEKSVSNGATSVAVGEDVIFDVTVTNTGNVTLRNVTITDPLTGNENMVVSTALAPQASATVQVTYGPVTEQNAIAGSIINTVSAHGTPPDGVSQPESPSASATIPVTSSRSLKITKSVTPTHILNPQKNDTVTWSMTIENTGTLTLNGIVLVDDLLSNRNVAMNLATTTLAPGKSVTIDNLVMPLKQEDIDAGSITNTAIARAVDPMDSSKTIDSNQASASVTLGRTPNLSVSKTARKTSVVIGETVTYDIVVRNTGNVTLQQVRITDAKLGITNQEVAATLAPGNEVTVPVISGAMTEADAIAGSMENIVTATGIPPTGLTELTATDTETVSVTGTASLVMEKTTPVATIPDATTASTVTWNFVIRNTGSLTVNDISVADTLLANRNVSVTPSKRTLAPSETATGAVTMTLTQEDIDTGSLTNVAKAMGVSSVGQAVQSPDDDATVSIFRSPSLKLEKTAISETVAVGEQTSFHLRVTNTGNVTLTNISVDDEKAGVSNLKVADSLLPGKSVETTVKYGPVTIADAQSRVIHNVAVARAKAPTGISNPVAATDDADVTVVAQRSLGVQKSASPESLENAKPGDEVTWGISVTNTGNVPLDGITIVDQMLEARGVPMSLEKASLAVGETTTAKVVMPLTQADIDAGKVENIAFAKAPDPLSEETLESNQADATVAIGRKADFSISKQADRHNASTGDTVNWTIVVTNTGNVTLRDVTLDDQLMGISNRKLTDVLNPGASKEVSVPYVVTETDVSAGQVRNIATASAKVPDGMDEMKPRQAEATVVIRPDVAQVLGSPILGIPIRGSQVMSDLIQTGGREALLLIVTCMVNIVALVIVVLRWNKLKP